VTDYERISSLLDTELAEFEKNDRRVTFWLLVAAVIASAWVGTVLILGLE
jgi:hypothetical protein